MATVAALALATATALALRGPLLLHGLPLLSLLGPLLLPGGLELLPLGAGLALLLGRGLLLLAGGLGLSLLGAVDLDPLAVDAGLPLIDPGLALLDLLLLAEALRLALLAVHPDPLVIYAGLPLIDAGLALLQLLLLAQALRLPLLEGLATLVEGRGPAAHLGSLLLPDLLAALAGQSLLPLGERDALRMGRLELGRAHHRPPGRRSLNGRRHAGRLLY